jgi:hypothetical protein
LIASAIQLYSDTASPVRPVFSDDLDKHEDHSYYSVN